MIEIRNAHKSLGEFSLRGVDLRVETGEYFVILGPTGAGKTVLLECIAGLHRLEQGEVWVDGREVTTLAPERRQIGYVPQDYVLFPHLTLERNIGFSLALRGLPSHTIAPRVSELADLLSISHLLSRRPRTLSGGEQQRGALARALAPRPTVLLLDEPLSALDEGTRADLSVELSRISRDLRTTILHVCHNFDEAVELADRVAIVHEGRVAQVGTPAEVFRRPQSAFVARFVGAQNLFPVTAVDREAGTVTVGEGLQLAAPQLPDGEKLLVMIRPEQIALTRTAAVPSWTLQRVEDRGRFMRLSLAGPLPLLVTMTPQAFRATGLSEGERVTVSWEPNAVHVLEG